MRWSTPRPSRQFTSTLLHPPAVALIACALAPAVVADPVDDSERESARCWSGLQTVPEYLSCLASIPLDPVKRDCTLEIIGTQLNSVYTYSGLVRNSSNNDAELAPQFNLSVYEMALGPEIDELWSKLKAETSAGLFAMKISQLFLKFNDAHTNVRFNPVYLTDVWPPVRVEPRLDEQSGEMKFFVVSNRSWARAGLLGKTLSKVNGKPVLEYFLDVADRRGSIKSQAARLNWFLIRQMLDGVPPPDDGVFNATFEDGSFVEMQWMANMQSRACGPRGPRICTRAEVLSGRCANITDIMKRCFEHNPNFGRLQTMMAKLGRKVLPCSEGGTVLELPANQDLEAPQPSAEASEQAYATPDGLGEEPRSLQMGPWEEPGLLEEKPWASEEEARSESDTVDVAPPVDVILGRRTCEVLRIRLQGGKVASVLKLITFRSPRIALHCAKVAVGLAANESNGKLIVDVISNGGGNIEAGYLLNAYLYSKMPGTTYQKPYDACEWYDLPKNKELNWFVRLSKQALPDVQAVSNRQQHILAMARRMQDGAAALAADPRFFGKRARAKSLKDASACLLRLVNTTNGTALRGRGEGLGFDEQLLIQYQRCLRKTGAEPFRRRNYASHIGYRGPDILGCRWSNKHPQPFSRPSWDYYTSTVTKIRGGEPRNFSSLTFLAAACDAYRAHFPKFYRDNVLDRVAPQSKIQHLTYVSDGLCGSTCSVASTRPYLDGLTTFVTFGGVPGQPMDITAFNGGNVATYQNPGSSYGLWTDAVSAMVDAAVFFPNETLPSWPFLPIPMSMYSVSFAQRAEYARALGPKALPREWYLVPGSHHLNVWSSTALISYPRLPNFAKQKLYDIYTAAAVLPPKPWPRFTA